MAKWTPEEYETLRRMKLEGFDGAEIGKRLGRTVDAIDHKWMRLNETPERTAKRKAAAKISNARYRKREYRIIAHPHTKIVVIPKPTEELWRRLQAARDLQSPCSILLGEPPPGFSALDCRPLPLHKVSLHRGAFL